MGAVGKCILKYAGFNNEEMFKDVKNLSKKDVEDKYGYDSNTIRRYLKSCGYEVKDFVFYEKNRKMNIVLGLWKSGLTVREMSLSTGMSDDCIYFHLKNLRIDYIEVEKDISKIKGILNGEEFKVYHDTHLAISNYGRVYSFYCNRLLKNHEKEDKNKGYLYAVIGKKSKYIHRMVAEMFVENPMEYKEVNHIDMNRSNNVHTNLEWCDRSHNIRHMLSNPVNYKNSVIRARMAGMKNAKKVICVNDGMVHNSISDAKRYYGINGAEQISRVCNGKNKYVIDKHKNKLKFEFVEGDNNE